MVLMALPLAMVRPAMVAVVPGLTSKTRLALLPLTVSLAAPGPLMVMFWVRMSWPLVRPMVPCRLGAKLMTAPDCAVGGRHRVAQRAAAAIVEVGHEERAGQRAVLEQLQKRAEAARPSAADGRETRHGATPALKITGTPPREHPMPVCSP